MKFEEKWESERKEEVGADTWPSCFAGGQCELRYKRAGIFPVLPCWRVEEKAYLRHDRGRETQRPQTR